jgi:hypothetical protein
MVGAQVVVGCSAYVDRDLLAAELRRALGGLGVSDPVVDVSVVERLERDPGPAKLRRFVPLGDCAPVVEPVLSAAV